MKDTLDLQSNLSQFIGTEKYYFNPLYRWMQYTEGAKYFFENAGGGAYWFSDIIGTEMKDMALRTGFLSITLSVTNGKAVILVTDGDYEEMYRKHISFTDCPDGEWKFFVVGGVLMLTSEY
jgi:hypothetical protein